ncbi:conserved hypothetical membrane protein [Thermoplasma acidophilum]|uniref:Conserved hypothetical membrane protein n=1 Tax=Thermoplasma acidophilum (strain ATCC 25905 / DSM 1728 / JCM 9062 / NBRC 15155 / AMRC-C165) TaxID=273075 RepID=Q9HLN0_THEAC|nr:OFA family MFS transporter [Thermoplasma acidophilum]CAC11343.1 conserved hypothetical membrane protein [Thermoplasma acidophilum]
MKRGYLVIALVVMSMNSLYQYSWNVLEPMISIDLHTSTVYVEVAFTLFTVFSTTFQGVGGYFADRDGPARIGMISAILSAFGFLGGSFVHSIYEFYAVWSIGSIGEGILYGIATNLAVKWYSNIRGFAVGIVSLGFGLGSSVANVFLVHATGFRAPMLIIGLMEIVLMPILMYLTRYPGTSLTGERPRRNLSSPVFWILYASFVFGSVPLLVISSSFGYIGRHLPALEFSLLVSIFPLMSGISRPMIGWLSDRIGRSASVMMIDVFIIAGSAFLVARQYIPAIVIIGFFGGSMISLYFSYIGDVFGTRFSTANNGVFYTGKSISGFIGSTIFALLFAYDVSVSFIFVLISGVIGLALLIASRGAVKKRQAM